MKSSFDILSALYQILNVPEINDIISGEIYIGDIPAGDQAENISLKTLNNPNAYLQVGYVNVNIYVKEIQSGRPDLVKFNQLIKAVIPLLKDANNNGYSFQIDDDKGIFKDENKSSMYFYNLKLTFQTK